MLIMIGKRVCEDLMICYDQNEDQRPMVEKVVVRALLDY